MAKTAEFKIVINGIQESINAVDALNEKLNTLESRINALQGKVVNVVANVTESTTTSAPQNTSSRTAELKEEDTLLKQIEQTEQSIADVRRDEYQELLNQKEILKETKKEASSRFAEDNLALKEYSNTMLGVKDHLADLKKAMQTKDMDSDEFKKMAQEAGELNAKLKEAEKSYGVFSRDVGNYANGVANGLKGVQVQVGDTVMTFSSAKQAARELGNELKNMAVNGQQGTKEYKELDKAVKKLNSDLKDVSVSSKWMDTLLDTMQGIVAVASTAKGLGAIFGLDGDAIEQSIQKLVALQNVMQGIESISKQMKTGEGIGGWLAKGNDAIDNFVSSLTGAKKAQQELNTTMVAGKTASEGLEAAETAQAAATNSATLATKGLSLALKAIGIGLVISLVSTLITYWEDIYNWFTDTIPALKNLEKWFGKIRAVATGVGTAIINYMVQPLVTLAKVIKAIVEGNFTDIPKIIGEGFKKTFDIAGNFQKGYNKETERQQDAHNKKMLSKQEQANEEWLKNEEAKFGKSHKRTQKYLKDQMAIVDKEISMAKKGSKEYDELIKKRNDYQRQLWTDEREEREEGQKKALKDSKEYAKKQAEAEKELYRLKIANMKEGLNKVITQLEEERRQKLAKIKSDGVMVAELELETNKYYDKKIEEATKEHTEKVEKTYKDMWNSIYQMSLDNYKKSSEIAEKTANKMAKNLENAKNQLMNQSISSYGVQGKNQLSEETRKTLNIISVDKDEAVQDYKKLIDIQREVSMAENAYKTLIIRNNAEIEVAENKLVQVQKETNEKLKQLEWNRAFMWDDEYEKKKYEIEKELDIEKQKYQKLKEEQEANLKIDEIAYNAKLALLDDYNKELAQKYYTQEDQARVNEIKNLLIEESYTKDLKTMFNQRLSAVEAYWATRIANEKISAEALYQQNVELENKEFDARKRNIASQEEELIKIADKNLEDELITQKQRDDAVDRIADEAQANRLLAEKEHNLKLEELEREKTDKLKSINAEYYQESLQEFRDFQTAISELASKQPVMNGLGIVNLKQTNKNNKELLDGYENLVRKIAEKRISLNKEFQEGVIDENIYKQSLRELDNYASGVGEKMDDLRHKLSLSGQIEQLAEGINQWIQQVGQAANSILGSISEIESNQYADRIAKQEKYIEEYEKLLDKQKEATQKYADAVKDIEDELSTARGDRRQQLIDALNAEMAAQRASLAQEKKIEKEKEKAEEKKKDLENEQAQRKWEMDKAQAYINAAMAVSMAAVNKWPIPAIPMMALAAAVGAAQIAAVISAKPKKYATGGVIEGKSHRQGGVKVLGGRAEVEGGEYITNKATTTNNVELLDYINTKKKKLSLDDMIEFYGSGSVRKNIKAVRTKFADGGQLPTLRNDIDLSDRMLTAFEDYSNRPVQVAVVDIQNATDRVNQVKVLSGLEV